MGEPSGVASSIKRYIMLNRARSCRLGQPQTHSRHVVTSCKTLSRPVCVSTSSSTQYHAHHAVVNRQWSHQQVHHRSRKGCLLRAEPGSSPAPSADAAAEPTEQQFQEDFDLLSSEIAELAKSLSQELRGCSIYLIGMMGSGKSTVGRMLANTLKYAYFDTDAMIEATHDKRPVSHLFAEHGEEYFRTCETEVMKQLAPYRNLVVATGGGAVLSTNNWGHMQGGVVAWLSGEPELLARRVAKDGVDKRPLLAAEGDSGDNSEAAVRERAQAKLSAILEERRRYYENADIVVELRSMSERDAELGAPTALVMYRLLKALNTRIKTSAEEREAKRKFVIEYQRDADRPPHSMRTMPSPGSGGQPERQA